MSRGVLLPTCLLVLGVVLAANWGTPVVNFIPCTRRQAATGLAASALATLMNTEAANAKKGTKFSVFGFGDGYSDPYNTLDTDSPSPYSEFSNPENRIRFEVNPEILERKKTALTESFKRLEKIPEFIRTKQSEEIKSTLTLQLYTLRFNMEYITAGGAPFFRNDNEETPAFKKANGFFLDISQIQVYGGRKKWDDATNSYNAAMDKLAEWKELVSF